MPKSMLSYQALILVGNDRTGKTSLQRHLIHKLCGVRHARLPINTCYPIKHAEMPQRVETLSAMNRSIQEKLELYESVAGFFEHHFVEANICLLSSHSVVSDIDEMIRELHRRAFNVTGVFFSNRYDLPEKYISELRWDERLWLENPEIIEGKKIEAQLIDLADQVTNWILRRSTVW